MTQDYTTRTAANLATVHPDLQKLAHRADELTEVEFLVTEGIRTMKRQRELVAAGASQTLKSRHLTGHAIDIVPLIGSEVCWKSQAFWLPLEAFRKAARELAIDVEFGADWRTLKDLPHIQLSRKSYPA